MEIFTLWPFAVWRRVVSRHFINISKEHTASIIYSENVDVTNSGYHDPNMTALET
jgi:hypothetical protein